MVAVSIFLRYEGDFRSVPAPRGSLCKTCVGRVGDMFEFRVFDIWYDGDLILESALLIVNTVSNILYWKKQRKISCVEIRPVATYKAREPILLSRELEAIPKSLLDFLTLLLLFPSI